MTESGVPGTGTLPGAGWRRRAGAAAVIVGVLAVAHTATWFVVTGRMLQAVPEAVAAAAADGWRVEAGAARRGGWPGRAAVVLDGVAITRELGGTRLRWTAEGLDAGIAAGSPTVAVVSPLGAQTVTVGAGAPAAVQAGRMDVRVPLRGGAVVAVARDVAVRGAGWGVGVGAAEMQWDGQAVALTAEGVVPSPGMAPPFDGAADLVLHAVATQPFPVAATPGESARAWRQAGGRLEVRSFGLHLAALAAEGSGEGGLDRRLQPEGRATVRVTGAAAVLDAAAAAGLVTPGPASAARAVLQLLTLGARGGPVAVPLDLRDGVLTAARFPVVRMPVLDWGG